MKVTIESVKASLDKYGYYATEDLVHSAFLGLLNFERGSRHAGQDIYAVCLEGPPGAGKTEYAKVYTKLVKEIWNGNATMVEYQCDATTGKTELFEDINISAVIRGDAENVNIPGKLIEAIKLVNAGKRVVLFIDEYDKAKEETDAFLLQFLQSGKLNSTQHGDMEIKEEFKQNLQVILCKNDFRESLSGPLSRRLKIIRLKPMEPQTFNSVAMRKLVDERAKGNKVNISLVDFVSLIYTEVHSNQDDYLRLPACSEMFRAIEEADDLQKFAHASDDIIYKVIVENMFKDEADLETFENKMNKAKNSDLAKVIKAMKETAASAQPQQNLTDLIMEHVLKDATEQLRTAREAVAKQAQDMTAYFDEQAAKIEALKTAYEEKERERITLSEGTALVANNTPSNTISNFNDSTPKIRRGESVFTTASENWTPFYSTTLSTDEEQKDFDRKMRILVRDSDDLVTYEDGFLISHDEGLNVALVRTKENGQVWMKFYANAFAVPEKVLGNAYTLSKMLQDEKNTHQHKPNGLIYTSRQIPGMTQVQENIYKIETEDPKVLKALLEDYTRAPDDHEARKEALALTQELSKGGK